MKLYKIQRKSDGLFSTGGSWPQFTKNGKSWSNIGHVKNHMKQVVKIAECYLDCDLLEVEMTEKTVKKTSLSKYIFMESI